jgi:hypothetical protein
MQYVIGSWYRKDELAKRTCIFHMSSVLGAMFSGYLMAAVYHLNGVGGYRGWQWYFSSSFHLMSRELTVSQAVHRRRHYQPSNRPDWILATSRRTRDCKAVVSID